MDLPEDRRATTADRADQPSADPGPADRFADRVAAVVAGTRPGQVVTYGEVAAEAGRPGAARAVGAVLRASSQPLPWWRVVTASGRLVPGLEDEHAAQLRDEGVPVQDGHVTR